MTKKETLKNEIEYLQNMMFFIRDRYEKKRFTNKQYIQNINMILDEIQKRQIELLDALCEHIHN